MWTLWNNETFKTGSLKCFMKWLCLQRNNLLLKFMNNGYSVFNDQRQQARNDSVTNMCIIFTNKLSKMVAHYEYLRVMINNKIMEKNDKQQDKRQTWKTLFWEKGLQTKMVDNIMFIRQANVHYMVPMFEQLG